ncbi:MAG: IS1 family transposase [Ekhidna sp.]|nr:IS1 family transposase [Ekhidna sp.]
MKIQITLTCPQCKSTNIVKNGKKTKKQNYLCNACSRQFIGDHALSYKGAHSNTITLMMRMLVRGCGIRDISDILNISLSKVLKTLEKQQVVLQPKHSFYDKLEIDEFWTYVGKKRHKLRLIYAYHRASGEIVAWVFGKRNTNTVRELWYKIKALGIKWGGLLTDNWKRFKRAFSDTHHVIGKEGTKGIEGNNCRLSHRIRRAFRQTCCFSKKMENHIKAFELAFYYINYGHS